MLEEILDKVFINQTAVLLIVTGLLLALAEFGYHTGLAARRRNADAAEGLSGAAQGAVLGLLGLLLGFSFALAVGRYDARRALAVEEANAIGTTWLRADFLPEHHARAVRNLLRTYTEDRLKGATMTDNKEAFARVLADAQGIHAELWRHAVESAHEQPSPITATFIGTLNETIDLHSDRLAAMRNRVPAAVWLLLLVVSGCGAWANGHGSGAKGHRSLFNQIVFPVLIGIVITLITDIDSPRKGLISVSQQPLQDLLETMPPPEP